MSHAHLGGLAPITTLLAIALAAGCAGPAPQEGSAPAEAVVEIRSFMFEPQAVRVNVGTTVVWSNRDDIAHTVTSGIPGRPGIPGVSEDTAPRPDALFDEPLDAAGASAAFTFQEPGEYAYFCSIHDGMTGAVEVS